MKYSNQIQTDKRRNEMKHLHRGLRAAAAVLALILATGILSGFAFAESFPYSAAVTASSVTVYSDAALTKKAGTLSRGAVVSVQQAGSGLIRFTYKGAGNYYCAADAVTGVAEISAPMKAACDTQFYESMSTSSRSVPVSAGTVVNVLNIADGWALAEAKGYGGYMIASCLTQEETPDKSASNTSIPCVVTYDNLPVFAQKNTSSKRLGTLEIGTELNVVSYDKTWACVEKDGNYGYCATAGLKAASQPEPKTPEVKPLCSATVKTSGTKVYQKASTGSDLLCTLERGFTVNVIAYNNTWAYIEKNGYYGYCATSALTTGSISGGDKDEQFRRMYPNAIGTATVIVSGAPAYLAASPSTVYARLPLGQTVDVYAYNDKWTYLGVGGKRAFVETKYVSAAAYSALGTSSSGSAVTALQKALEKLGYLDGTPDGSYGAQTVNAVQRFQSAVGFSQTGTADVTTLRVLTGGYAPESDLLSKTLSSGMSNSNVQRMQTRLYYLGYYSKTSSVDGDYGAISVSAVKLFQTAAGLNATGTADPATLRALYANGAPHLPSGKDPADYSSGSSSSGNIKVPAGLASTQSTLPANPTKVQKIEYVLYVALQQLGKPYVYGAAGPNSFDCSGLTTYCYQKVGVSLGRSAYAQGYEERTGIKIPNINALKRGDIVFFDTISDSDSSDHAGLYLGNGYFVHASSGSGNGKRVVISSLTSGYYNRVFSWGRRPLN